MSHSQDAALAGLTGEACNEDDLFRDLPEAERAQLERSISAAAYPMGHTFYSPDEPGDGVLLLRRGRVRLYKLSPEGRALTLHILGPGAVFGELALAAHWRHDSFAEAMTDCEVGTLGRDALRHVLSDYPAVALRFMELMSRRLRALEHKLADIAFRSVPQRLASALLRLANCAPGQPVADPPEVVRYTHQQLAELIGSYRETVTKAIGEFREAGLIRIEEDAILLTDVPRLRALAQA